MVKLNDVLERARSMMRAAEAMGAAPGAAGLAYQAADLATKVLLVKTDGADIWAHAAREERVAALLPVSAAELRTLHKVRQLDFYADASAGSPFELPTQPQLLRAIEIARQVVDAVEVRLLGRLAEEPPKKKIDPARGTARERRIRRREEKRSSGESKR
jgi:HEPN domain-containing protein